MKYKILILSNPDNYVFQEDLMLKERFEKDGNVVDLRWVDYDSSLDNYYDLIIRRDTWVEDIEKVNKYKEENSKLINRLKDSKKTINLIGLDGEGKNYLKKLFYDGYKVIPTTDSVEDALKWNNEEYVLKLKESYGSGIGQLFVNKEELNKLFSNKYLIQPKIEFISEVQVYFINDTIMYTHEYVPSKYPDYPKPSLINLSKEEEEMAILFSNISNVKTGMKRVDFLRLKDNSLLLLEIEDNSPHMNIELLDKELRDKVLDYYVEGIYKYINNINK